MFLPWEQQPCGVIQVLGVTCTCRPMDFGVSLAFNYSCSIAFPVVSKSTFCEIRKRALNSGVFFLFVFFGRVSGFISLKNEARF